MEEIQQDYSAGVNDSEATIVQPRFDALEAQTAQPVVPLSRVAAWRQRRLPIALVLVSALFGGIVSVFAYRLYQRAARPHAAPSIVSAQTQQPAPSPDATTKQDAAPAKPAHEPAPSENVPTEEAKNETPNAAPADASGSAATASRGVESGRRNDAGAVTTPRAERRAVRQAEESATREDRRRGDEVHRARNDQQSARRVDVITSPSAIERVGQDRRRGDEDAGDGQSFPEGREGRHARRVKGRNIDRIRDIFGAPPPA